MPSASELCSEGNEQYVNENYQKAVELYTEALKLEETRDDIYCHRAQAKLQLGNYADAVADLDKAIELNGANSKAYLKKGSALFQMGQVQNALDVFKEAKEKFDGDNSFSDWINKCEAKLPKPNPTPAPSSAPAPSKVKHEWYQTHTHVIVTVLAKGVKKENLKVDVEERQLNVLIKDYHGENVDINMILAHKVDAEQSVTKLFGTKIEVKLKKQAGIMWEKLEGEPDKEVDLLPAAAAVEETHVPKYPSSSHYTRDWDKLAAEVAEEEKNEKLEGDAGLNQFFQKLYADASDETKKAMMKSYTESGGTVLSTNWSEVGSKKVDVKPPDGMEYKKWEY